MSRFNYELVHHDRIHKLKMVYAVVFSLVTHIVHYKSDIMTRGSCDEIDSKADTTHLTPDMLSKISPPSTSST